MFDFCDWVISLASPCVPMFAPISCPHIFSYDVSHKWFFNSCVRVVYVFSIASVRVCCRFSFTSFLNFSTTNYHNRATNASILMTTQRLRLASRVYDQAQNPLIPP